MAYPQVQRHWTFPINGREAERFFRFALVGGVGTVVDFSVLIVLKEIIGLPLILANSLSYLAGVTNNFTLNRLWTYPEARSKALWRQFLQFLMVSTMGLLLSNLIVGLLAAPLGELLRMPDRGYLAAKVLATGIVVFWNFTANRLWTFNDPHSVEADGARHSARLPIINKQ